MNIFRKFFPASILLSALLSLNLSAQTPQAAQPDLPKNWHTMDLKADGFYGISLTPAYQFIKGKKSKTVLVATIDSGIDTAQKDLQGILWVNPKEIPGNGIDDDHNGYVDDVHGWDFLGGAGGKVDYTETTEEVREYNRLKTKFESKDFNPATLKGDDADDYKMWLSAKKSIIGD